MQDGQQDGETEVAGDAELDSEGADGDFGEKEGSDGRPGRGAILLSRQVPVGEEREEATLGPPGG